MGGWVAVALLSANPMVEGYDECQVLSEHAEKGDAVVAALVAEVRLGKPEDGSWVIGVGISRKPTPGYRPFLKDQNITWATSWSAL